MHIITVATHSEGYFPWLKMSCERNNIDLVVLGWGKEWKGYTWRCHLILEYIKNLQDDEIICFIDAYDVIILQSAQEIENSFLNMVGNKKDLIIVGEEKLCTIPQLIYYHLAFGIHSFNEYKLNAGSYIGYVSMIKKLLYGLLKINNDDSEDDQILLLKYYNNNYNNILVDEKSNMFLVLLNSLFEIDNYCTIYNDNLYYGKYKPCILHAAGNTLLSNILIKLKYKFTTNDYDNILLYHKKFIYKKYKYYINLHKNIYFFIILIIIIIIIIYKYKLQKTY